MFNKINHIASKLLKLWEIFVQLLKVNPRFCCAFYQLEFNKRQERFWNSLLKIDSIKQTDIMVSYNQGLENLCTLFVKVSKRAIKTENWGFVRDKSSWQKTYGEETVVAAYSYSVFFDLVLTSGNKWSRFCNELIWGDPPGHPGARFSRDFLRHEAH